MNIAALLTSAGINIGVSVLLLSLYSVLRKQPSNLSVYFGRRLAQVCQKRSDPVCFDRFVPSPSWIVKAWEASEEDILSASGLDAVVFIRILVFSIRIFIVAAIIGIFLVLPLNYYGQEFHHEALQLESLDVFSIGNVKEGSKWLAAHCLALYIISSSACILLYIEYKSITKMRLSHIVGSSSSPSYFTVLVRAIPWNSRESFSDSLRKFFTFYHASSYLSHQMVYLSGTLQKLMSDIEKMYRMMKSSSNQCCKTNLVPCVICGHTANAFKIFSSEPEEAREKNFGGVDLGASEKECSTAFVFFKTRYSALIASQLIHSSNPMLWVTELAPEPRDVYWSNLCIPYKQIWLRRIAVLVATILFMFLFIIPVTFVQGLTELDQLQRTFPFMKGILKKTLVNQLVTGYLPSVVLMLFLYAVPPMMMLLSAVGGSTSHSGRKKTACRSILYFSVWVVFFVNVLSHSVISQLDVISHPKDIPTQLAKAVPTQAGFFMTYVLSSGWASLSCEAVQLFPLLCNLFIRFILRKKDDPSYGTLSFPYHTEVPRVLLFGLLGFTCSILAPLILPLLLVYFFLAFLVYRNQILNVYVSKYETGGLYWPIAHNATIFSLVLTQIIALGVFGLKRSPVASGFTIPLVIGTLLFNQYCRNRFHPLFKNHPAQVLIEMDHQDEQSGRMTEIHHRLQAAYCQITLNSHRPCGSGPSSSNGGFGNGDLADVKPGIESIEVKESWAIVHCPAQGSM